MSKEKNLFVIVRSEYVIAIDDGTWSSNPDNYFMNVEELFSCEETKKALRLLRYFAPRATYEERLDAFCRYCTDFTKSRHIIARYINIVVMLSCTILKGKLKEELAPFSKVSPADAERLRNKK